LETTSSSGEQNENLLTEIINYIDERHSNLAVLITNQQKHQISNEIDLIESEISFLKEITRVNVEASISKLKSDLPILDQEISQLNQVIIDDANNLNIVKGSTLATERAASSPTLEQIISSYKSKINQLTRERNNSISDISILSQKLDALNKDTFQSDELFVLGKRQKILENQLKMLMNQTQVKTQPIGNIGTNTIKPKTQLIITLGIIIGFITSIFLVFINNFIKSYKESEA
jgi:LPS O-antigen subunit length determinant protein (WzzB/FepE family)